MTLADNGNKTKGFENNGIKIPSDAKQNQECQTAGGTSPVTTSCTAASRNTVANTGGVMSEEK
jgi:hypothetical protein